MTTSQYRAILAALAILGSLFVFIATSGYGPGLSTDGARYLSTAESLGAGRGVIDYLGQPLVNWPPLYPLILAAMNRFTGLDVFVIAQWLNILAFGGIVWLSGLLFERSLPGNYSFALIASLIMTASLPLIEVSANIASDPLFLLCTLAWLLVAQRYAQTRTRRDWWLLAALAAAACYLRYAGAALVMAGGLLVFAAWRPQWRKAIMEAAGYGLVSAAPIGAWAILHNYRLTGSLLGDHLPSQPVGLFIAAVEKVATWFVPGSLLGFVAPLALLGLLLAALALHSNRQRWAAWWQRILAAPVLPSAVFFLVYGLMMIFTISYPEHRVLGSQRLHAMLLPSLLVLAAVTAQELLPRLPRKPKIWRNLLLAAFALWVLFPLYRVGVYVLASRQNGDVSYYNLYNTRNLRESDIVAHLKSLDIPANERVYSNNEGAAWFYLRRQIYRLPRYDAEAGESLAAAMHGFEGWPADDETATLIWFKRELDYKELVPTPEAMQAFIRLTPTFTGRYGIVYLMDVDLGE